MCAAMIYTIPSLRTFFPQEYLEGPFQQVYWKWPLNDEESKMLEDFVSKEYQNYVIHPVLNQIFAAFHLTPLASVKVVILGQDPYPKPYDGPDIYGNNVCIQKATGLAFSVPSTIPIGKIPRSLKNIFTEVVNSGFQIPSSGCLEGWARQGVLLLNSALTVRHWMPASSAEARQIRTLYAQAWQTFTDNIIRTVSAMNNHVVFMLWGKFAKDKEPLIVQSGPSAVQGVSRHTILRAGHPSPLSAHLFFGLFHFAKCNAALVDNRQDPINWSL